MSKPNPPLGPSLNCGQTGLETHQRKTVTKLAVRERMITFVHYGPSALEQKYCISTDVYIAHRLH